MSTDDVATVVLCGNAGGGLWPVSRDSHPRQLLSLDGEESLFQTMLRRAFHCASLDLADTIVVCQESVRFEVAQQMEAIGRQARIVLEPVGRNTAAALTLGALQALEAANDTVLVVMPSDHVLGEPKRLEASLASAVPLARTGTFVALGVPPNRPEPGRGYVCQGEALPAVGPAEAWTIKQFVEMPAAELVQVFLNAGNHLCNSGVFVLRASAWLEALQRCRPDISATVAAAWVGRSNDHDFVRVSPDAYGRVPSESIEGAVLAFLAPAGGAPAAGLPSSAVVALNAGWSDMSSWSSLWDHLPKDAKDNVHQGDVLLVDTQGSLVFAQRRLVACCGVSDLVVVETPDAVLVTRRDQTQQVRQLVEHLVSLKRDKWRVHQKVYRPWGWFDSVDAGDRFQVKRIQVLPGASVSLQMHHHRAEHWIVVKGTAQVTCDVETFLLTENQSTYIPLGKSHRLENPGKIDLEMIEVQSGGYLGEDDIVRFHDIYGRG